MRIINIISIFLLTTITIFGLEIGWIDNDIEKAYKEAKAQNKLIMVDVYTDWCSWCKELDKTTYTDKKVYYYAKSFVTLKVNPEKKGDKNAAEFSKKYEVNSYPTILFIDGDGNLLKRTVGYKNADDFLDEMKSAYFLKTLKEEEKKYNLGDYGNYKEYLKMLDEQGNFKKIVDVYNVISSKKLIKDSDVEEVTFLVGKAMLFLDNYNEAILYFDTIENSKNTESIFYWKAISYKTIAISKLKDYKSAEEYLKKFKEIKRNKENEEIYQEILAMIEEKKDGNIIWIQNDINKAFEDIRNSEKILMVDVYTDWCSWCKELDKNVYSNEDVKNEIKDFISLKLDGENENNLEFVTKYKINGYPTVIFFNSNGEILSLLEGYADYSDFICYIKEAKENNKFFKDVKEEFQNNNFKNGYEYINRSFKLKNYSDIINIYDKIKDTTVVTKKEEYSLNYIVGSVFFKNMDFEKTKLYLDKVEKEGEDGEYFWEAVYYKGASLFYLEGKEKAIEYVNSYKNVKKSETIEKALLYLIQVINKQ